MCRVKRRKKRIYINLARSFEEADQWNLWFWKKVGALGRFSAAWLMLEDYYKMGGRGEFQPRLRRSVQNIKRS